MIADMSMAELTIADERTLARDAAGARARKEGLMLDRLVETTRESRASSTRSCSRPCG